MVQEINLKDIKMENDTDSDDELDSVNIENGNKSKIPFRKIGQLFLGIAIVVAIITAALPSGLVNKLEPYSSGVIFKALFGSFMICLFICLCFIYYLGSESQAMWDVDSDSFGDLNLSFSNVTAIIGIIIEFIQICSFSFNNESSYLGSKYLGYSNYLAIPYKPGTPFRVMYWIMFVIAFSPYIFVVLVRLVLHFMTKKFGEGYTATFVSNYQQNIYSILWFLVNTMYLPVIGTMFGGVDCTVDGSANTLDSDPTINCLKGLHIPFIICSLIALVMYYPAASFAQSQTQNISDIKFKPRVVFIFVQGKVILASMTVFATSIIKLYLGAVIAVNFCFLVINVILKPCLVEWVNRMRTVFFSFCFWCTICSWVAYDDDTKNYVPLVLLIVGWVVLAIGFFLFYTFRPIVMEYVNKAPFMARSNRTINAPSSAASMDISP